MQIDACKWPMKWERRVDNVEPREQTVTLISHAGDTKIDQQIQKHATIFTLFPIRIY